MRQLLPGTRCRDTKRHSLLPHRSARGRDVTAGRCVAALALEQTGKRDEAMALLQRYQALGTDVQGTLAGRIKRMWIENEDLGFAQHALALYKEALDVARKMGHEPDLLSFINVAFLEFVAFGRVERAREIGEDSSGERLLRRREHLERRHAG